jgi:very-short-patch-repair endonuclease
MQYKIEEAIMSGKKRLCYVVNCTFCGKVHHKTKQDFIQGMETNKTFFCSLNCFGKYNSNKIEVNCVQCNICFLKLPSQIKITKNNFCSKSCAATYNNKNKTYGTRRSKMEQIIEENIVINFPNLKFECNQKTIIGSELDFYFPDLKLAIQVNGIFHFEPIYGQEKLDRIKVLDEEKRIKCQEQNIKLYEINCSTDKYLNKKLQLQRWEEVKNILTEITKN